MCSRVLKKFRLAFISTIESLEGRKENPMKSMMKTFAMLSLSACVLMGCAVSSSAASPSASVVLGYSTSSCDDEARAEIVAQMEKDGTTTTYSICSSCGDVDDEDCLSEIDNAFANFSGLEAYTGVLDNGQRVMALGCISGDGAMNHIDANIEMPASYVEGYTLYQVTENGETPVSVSIENGIARFTVSMQDGAALLEMVEQ